MNGSTMCIDIETLPDTASVGMSLTTPPDWTCPEFTEVQRAVPKNIRDLVKIELREQENHARWLEAKVAHSSIRAKIDMEAYAKRSLSPLTGRVACIGYCIDDNPVQVIQCDDDEADGLRVLMDVMRARGVGTVINFGDFDYNFLWKLLMRMGHPYANRFRRHKLWDDRLLDAQSVWTGGSRRIKGVSMDAICEFFGWSREGNPIRGGDVFPAYVGGRMSEVVTHCREDVEDLRKLARKLEMMP